MTPAAILEGVLDAGISAGVNSAVTGAGFGQAFSDSTLKSVVSLGLADAQTKIGGLFQNGGEGSLGHVLLHGLAGCAAAELQRADCASGAAGGIAAAIYSGMQTPPKLDDFGGDMEAFRPVYDAWRADVLAKADIMALATGYLFSGGKAENVSVASSIATSAVENNYLKDTEIAQYEAALRDGLESCFATSSSFGSPECNDAKTGLAALTEKLQSNSIRNTLNMINACQSGGSRAQCQTLIDEAENFLAWRGSWFTRKTAIFDVTAEIHVENIDHGRNLDRLAVDIYKNLGTDPKDLAAANAQFHNAIINYDGVWNVATGGASIVIAAGGVVGACFLSVGTLCVPAVVGAGAAVVGSGDELADGAATLVLGRAIENPTVQGLQAVGISAKDAVAIEGRIDTGAMVVEIAAGGYAVFKAGRLVGKTHVVDGKHVFEGAPGTGFTVDSALSDASLAAFKAADRVANWVPKNKHLLGGGSQSKARFVSADIEEVRRIVANALRSDSAMFLPNTNIPGTFRVIGSTGQVIGSNGQRYVRIIVGSDGNIISAFPVHSR